MQLFWIILIVVVAALIAIIMGVTVKVFNVAVNVRAPKKKVFETNEATPGAADDEEARWLEGISFTEHAIKSFDGLNLFGREISADSDVWVISIHGFMEHGLSLVPYIRHFHEKGYNVLIPDLRACGESDGQYLGMGWLDRLDILKWIDHIVVRHPDARIVLYGKSMGGATVMMTTGEKLPENVIVAVEDCGYTSVWDEFSMQLKKVYHLPIFPILYLGSSMCKRKVGYSFFEASSVDQLKKSKTPTLFIHGTADSFVPYSMLDQVYDVCAAEKQKLSVEGAEHSMAAKENPQLYYKTVDDFLAKYGIK